MKIEHAIRVDKFRGDRHKALLNILYSGYWINSGTSAMLKTHNLTNEQYNVLHTLSVRHPEQVCVKDIAARMIEKSSNVPRIIDRLVEKELATRATSEFDKRETIVSITPKGLDVHASAMAGIDKLREETMNLTDDEAKQLSYLLDKMRAVAEPTLAEDMQEYSEASAAYSEK